MTKEEFFKIVDSGDSENYPNNPEFISFVHFLSKQTKEEYNQSRNQKRLDEERK